MFSGAVKLANLDDFIAPSQDCVVSLGSQSSKLSQDALQDGQVSLQPKSTRRTWSQTLPTKSATDPLKISLQDCLACSGCVTSAETVLLEHQSTGELTQRLSDPGANVVVTIAGQSLASLAACHGLTQPETGRKISAFLRSLGVRAVFDVSSGRDLALVETAAEFVERFKSQHTACQDISRQKSASQCSTSGRAQQADLMLLNGHGQGHGQARCVLPMLASACPGWVCYAEKTHGDYALAHMSRVKSPQAVMGSFVKGPWARQHGLAADRIYHCAIMPCYDKKLEAARHDFEVEGTSVPETDSVLTTVEIQQLLDERRCVLAGLDEAPLDTVLGGSSGQLSGFPGGSGGYMEYTYRVAAEQLFGINVPPGPLPMRKLRNADFQETTLEVGGRTVLRFALAYGFRNIQTLLRRIKQGGRPYDYVEVMACPAGCLNGGGQLPRRATHSAQQLISEVEAAYHHPQIEWRRPDVSPEVQQLYREWIRGGPGSAAACSVLHTQYHKREKSVASAIKDW